MRSFAKNTALAAGLALSLLTPALAARGAFSDISSTTPYARAIADLKGKGILAGYSDGTFRPNTSINRAEFLKIVLTGRGSGSTIESGNCFPDVTNQWFAPYVCRAKAEGIVSGYDNGLFRPEQPVTFAEAGKILALAFKQNIQNSYGGEWYEPYALALESAKAIPPSASGLSEHLTRGEMAEMLWRLTMHVTDQPTKAYLNVKYPSLSINLASDTVQHAQNCGDLQVFMQEAQTQGGGNMMRGGGIMMENMAVPPTAAVPTGAATNAADHSTTNVQVSGVDEGDIVKTDGTNLYAVTGNTVRIVRAMPSTGMQLLGSLTDTGSSFTPSELYIVGTRLIVIGQRGGWGGGPIRVMGIANTSIVSPYPSYQTPLAEARIFNVSNPAHPLLERKVSFDGSTVSTRMIGNVLYLIVNQPMPWFASPLAKPAVSNVLPSFQDSKTGSTSQPIAQCGDIAILPHVPFPQYLTVGAIDVSNPQSDVARQVVLGRADDIYASLDNLYVATNQWTYHWDVRFPTGEEKTLLYRFAFTKDGIDLQAQGSVPGHILNQFSMDEQGATFRIATTTQTGTDVPQTANNLYVLGKDLSVVGKLEDIALGESIYAVRFIGTRAYMVTFQSIDPLFVIDLSSPRSPKVLGELSIPGYSNYLQPYDATHLIGFGNEVDASIDKDKVHTPGAVYYTAVQGLKLALFDVSDVTHPVEMAKTVIGDRGSTSPLLTDHHALLFEKDTGLLAFPVLVYQNTPGQAADQQGRPVFQGAYVYNVSLQGGFKFRGQISQYDSDAYVKAGNYWFDQGKDVQRIVRISDALFTVSDGEVMSSDLSTLAKENTVAFPASHSPSPCGDFAPCPMPLAQ